MVWIVSVGLGVSGAWVLWVLWGSGEHVCRGRTAHSSHCESCGRELDGP